MKSNFNDSREGTRSVQRAKRRKTNIILNSLIGLVLLLIIIVSVSIFSRDSGEKEKSQEQNTEQKVSSNNEVNAGKKASSSGEKTDGKDVSKSVKEQTAKTASKTVKANEKPVPQKNSSADDKEDREAGDSQAVTEGGGDNVKSTIIKPGWEPVGTSQTGPFSDGDTDWAEREKALAYAIGVDKGNMVNWYLGRAGENQSIGTISAKDDPGRTFRVYLEWQDGKGWMPVKVEELIENDKR